MELASANCADCCSDCAGAAPACCTAAGSAAAGCCDAASACCDANCQLLPPDPINYEYHEPEENFVSIDDAKIKNLLFKIGQQQQQELRRQQQERQQQQREQQRRRQQQQQIIELLDDDEQQPQLTLIAAARSFKQRRRNSPDIQLIPTKPVEQRVVARIDLSDSECEFVHEEGKGQRDEDDDDDEEDLPLAAVSCELKETAQLIVLQSDDDDDDEDDDGDDDDVEQRQQRSSKATSRKRAPRPYIKRRIRHYYQCQACGKKVQSNYNLRRHMMIHTGERQLGQGCNLFIFTLPFLFARRASLSLRSVRSTLSRV